MTSPEQSPVVCFLDESATDARDSDQAVVGGTVLNRKDIAEFDASWSSMLARHGATVGIHMSQLGPKGPYPHLVGEACVALLADAVEIINKTRIFTFAVSLDNRQHEELFSKTLREQHFSVYAMAFLMVIEINRASAVKQGYRANIDFVFDDGNRFKRHLLALHSSARSLPELSDFNVGSLEFKTDSDVPALQGADIIAWSARRRKAGKDLKGIHAPLNNLFDDCYADSPIPQDVLQQLAASFARAEAGLLDES